MLQALGAYHDVDGIISKGHLVPKCDDVHPWAGCEIDTDVLSRLFEDRSHGAVLIVRTNLKDAGAHEQTLIRVGEKAKEAELLWMAHLLPVPFDSDSIECAASGGDRVPIERMDSEGFRGGKHDAMILRKSADTWKVKT